MATLFDGPASTGSNTLAWDCRDTSGAPVEAGVYLLVLEAGAGTAVRRIAIVH